MKVCGFSFIRNARIYDYAILEAIQSILPICDEFVIAVGDSEDDTLELIENLQSPKIKIIHTQWNNDLKEKKWTVLAQETDKAFQAIAQEFDWAFYIQGDEVVHEKYLDTIRAEMIKHKDNKNVDGLLFNYLHFYGSFEYVGNAQSWYDHEIRVIKNDKLIYSYHDAQGFRKANNEKLKVIPIDAYIYHYGWVRDPKAFRKKHNSFINLYKSPNAKVSSTPVYKSEDFDYNECITQLKYFEGTHPAIMQKRIAQKRWTFEVDMSIDRRTWKDKIKYLCKKYLGINLNYKNYIIIKA